MTFNRFFALLLLLSTSVIVRAADDTPAQTQNFTHRITGFCCPEREADLREVVALHPELKLVSVDYEHAQATFAYDPKLVSTESLSNSIAPKAFHIKPPSTTPPDKLATVEMKVGMLDCKACCLGVYNVITRIDGVEQANVTRNGHAVVIIDSTKTTQAAIEDALKKAGVPMKGAKTAS